MAKDGFRRPLTKSDFIRLNIGRAYWDKTLKNFRDSLDGTIVTVVENYCRNIDEMIKTGSGLLIGGDLGSGKTSLAIIVMKEATRCGYTTYFITHAEMRDLQFTDRVFGRESDGITVRARVRDAQLLVIDGLDDAFFTDKVFGPVHLERLVRHRNAHQLVTLVTTRAIRRMTSGDYAEIFDIMTSSMVPLVLKGDNLRDKERDVLRERVLGGAGS